LSRLESLIQSLKNQQVRSGPESRLNKIPMRV
jgi:hypothetical protein